jgi:hypothetical protein
VIVDSRGRAEQRPWVSDFTPAQGVKAYTQSTYLTDSFSRSMRVVSCNALSGSMDAVAFR